MEFFDSHAHLNDKKFKDDLEFVIKRALNNDIKHIMVPAIDYETSVEIVDLVQEYDCLYGAVGVHPHDAKILDDNMLSLIKVLAKKDKIKAIGEIGLDYHYDFTDRETQKYWFKKQCELAKELNMPIIIHDREANNDVLTILKEVDSFKTGVLMHCYSGSRELAEQYVKLGAYISIAGPVTFKNARKLPEVIETVPLDRLMIETDSPYLTPHPFRGKRNESLYVKYVAEKIAEIKGISLAEVAEHTTANAKRYFNI